MYFRRIIIKNILCHRYRDLTLQRGLIGVFGRNGSGKSTLLNLMYAVLTNDFGRFPGTRAQCINNRSEKKEEAYVYGEVVVGEQVLKIRRGLRQPVRSELQVDDEEPITDANKIKERVEEILGMNATLLDLFVFKQQDKIYDIFVATEATRKEAYQALNRTEKCEKIYDAIAALAAKDRTAMEGFTDNSDEILQSQGAVQESIKVLKAEIEEKGELLLNDTSYASANKILDDWKTLRRLNGDLTEVRDTLPELRKTRDDKAAREKSQQDKIADLIKQIDKLKPKAAVAAVALRDFAAYEKQAKRIRALTAETAELLAEKAEHTQPVPPKGYKSFDLKAAQAKVAKLRDDLKAAKKWLEGFDATGVSKCSECGTVLERADDKLLKKYRDVVADYPAEIKALDAEIEDAEYYVDASVAYVKWSTGYVERVKANKQALEDLDALKAPEGDKAQLQQVVDDLETAEEDLEQARTTLTTRQSEAARAAAAVEAAENRMAELRDKVAELTVTETKYEKARRRLDEHDKAKEEIAEIRGELRTKEARLQELNEELDAVEAKAKRFQKTRQLLKIYGRAQEVVHRDGLPTRVAQTNLAKLEGYVNDELAGFGNPFWVETGDDLQFIVHKPGEPPQTAPWLSTGWKCVLAGAFWMTIVAVWADCGMLCLDEPTANLDEENRSFLADALSRLTGRIRGNRQVIMVSHAEELRSSFDQVIDFTPDHDDVAQAG